MKYRVRSLATGKKYKCSAHEKLQLMPDGSLFYSYREDSDFGHSGPFTLLGGYVLEFAFLRDTKGKWVWSECVVSD